ncbi:MAG: hypothetical protein ACKOB3_01910 [Holophagaceae bacterium]
MPISPCTIDPIIHHVLKLIGYDSFLCPDHPVFEALTADGWHDPLCFFLMSAADVARLSYTDKSSYPFTKCVLPDEDQHALMIPDAYLRYYHKTHGAWLNDSDWLKVTGADVLWANVSPEYGRILRKRTSCGVSPLLTRNYVLGLLPFDGDVTCCAQDVIDALDHGGYLELVDIFALTSDEVDNHLSFLDKPTCPPYRIQVPSYAKDLLLTLGAYQRYYKLEFGYFLDDIDWLSMDKDTLDRFGRSSTCRRFVLGARSWDAVSPAAIPSFDSWDSKRTVRGFLGIPVHDSTMYPGKSTSFRPPNIVLRSPSASNCVSLVERVSKWSSSHMMESVSPFSSEGVSETTVSKLQRQDYQR